MNKIKFEKGVRSIVGSDQCTFIYNDNEVMVNYVIPFTHVEYDTTFTEYKGAETTTVELQPKTVNGHESIVLIDGVVFIAYGI